MFLIRASYDHNGLLGHRTIKLKRLGSGGYPTETKLILTCNTAVLALLIEVALVYFKFPKEEERK